MQFEWSAEQSALRKTFADLGRASAQRRASRRDGESSVHRFDGTCWSELAEAGLWRLAVPADSGGQGGSWWDFAAAFEGLSSTARSTGLLMTVANQASVIRAILTLGTVQQRERHLASLLDGALSATAMSEPSTGSDVRGLQTRLSGTDGCYRLHGSKYNVSHAPTADLLLVIAKHAVREREGVALLLIDREVTGLTRSAPCETLGNRDLPIGELSFSDVDIRPEHLLGKPGEGHRHLMEIASMSRVLFSLASAHVLMPFLDDAVELVRRRRSFESTLDSHQYVQGRIVDMKLGIERTRWLSYAALGQVLTRADEAVMTASLAKLTATQGIVDGALDLLRLFGSVGYRKGAVAEFVGDALGLLLAGGTEEMHRVNVFSQIARLHQKAAAEAAA